MHAEIVLSETHPETEWVRGRALQKTSPTFDHSRVQAEITIALSAWASGRGVVGPEWRFRIEVPGEARRPLVPDVAYVGNERLAGFSRRELQAPPFAPTAAFEILSPRDANADVDAKIDDYLKGGCELVIVVDPRTRTMRTEDPSGTRVFGPAGTFEHAALPGFALDVAAMFARALDAPLAFDADRGDTNVSPSSLAPAEGVAARSASERRRSQHVTCSVFAGRAGDRSHETRRSVAHESSLPVRREPVCGIIDDATPRRTRASRDEERPIVRNAVLEDRCRVARAGGNRDMPVSAADPEASGFSKGTCLRAPRSAEGHHVSFDV